MATKTQICNLALSHLGIGKAIANVETERSAEATACRTFYDTTRDEMLRSFVWPFATKVVGLSLVEEDPNEEWAFSYRYPTDCLYFKKIQSGTRNDTQDTVIPYRIAYDDTGRLIFTDREDAIGEYTVRVTDPNIYPPDFVMALSLRLAAYIAPSVTSGDQFKLGDRSLKLFLASIEYAQTTALEEEQPEALPESELIRSRS